MNPPWLFTHGNDAVARGEGRSEMDVRHFREGVANGVVDRAFADFTALNVRDGNPEGERDGGGSEHFVAVGDEEKKVGTKCAEVIGKAQRGDADCFSHADVGVGAEKTFDARGDLEAVVFNFADGGAEFRGEMSAEDDELQVDERLLGERAERPK